MVGGRMTVGRPRTFGDRRFVGASLLFCAAHPLIGEVRERCFAVRPPSIAQQASRHPRPDRAETERISALSFPVLPKLADLRKE